MGSISGHTHCTGPIPSQEYSFIEMKLLRLLLPLLVVASCSGFSLDSILGGAAQETEAEKPIDEIEAEEEEGDNQEEEEEEEEELEALEVEAEEEEDEEEDEEEE